MGLYHSNNNIWRFFVCSDDGLQALCAARSDESGKFVFKGITCGRYVVVPFYRSTEVTFDVVPSNMSISVGHANLQVSETFRVAGFSVIGRVLDTQGKSIPSATVLLDGIERAVTDAHG